MPRLLAARRSVQQASAVVFLRNLHAAQEQYFVVHGQYAATFAELEGFLAANSQSLTPVETLRVRWQPVRNGSLPTLAFLLLPAPDVAGRRQSPPRR